MGETRSKHSGVIAAFASLVVERGGVAEEIGRALRSLYDQRSVADDGDDRVSGGQAEAARKASKIVAAVDHWLSEQGR